MADEQQLQQARDLITQKKYHEARSILLWMDHPTAKAWLAKLDQIAPDSFSTGTVGSTGIPKVPATGTLLTVSFVGMLTFAILGIFFQPLLILAGALAVAFVAGLLTKLLEMEQNQRVTHELLLRLIRLQENSPRQ